MKNKDPFGFDKRSFGLNFILGALIVLAVCVFILLCIRIIFTISPAQGRDYRQTKSDDMVTRNAIDDDFDRRIKTFEDMGIQSDTLKFVSGVGGVIVYLPQKYLDKNYTIFCSYRYIVGTWPALAVICYPLSDSSFFIGKLPADSSTVQWMSIHK